MAIRDYWIYQKRNVTYPWSLYVVKEYDVNQPTEYDVLDYTFYSELVDNKAKSVSKVGLNYDTLEKYVTDIANTISLVTEVAEEDRKQLEKELFYILRN